MIYEEMYHFLMKHVSAKEFDMSLVALLHMDWDGYVRTTPKTMANKINSTAKYVRHLIRKFKGSKKGRSVFVEKETKQGPLLRFDMVRPRHLGFRPHIDRYCKKYDLFYTEAFQALPIDAKRLLLAGAYTMSVSGCETVSIPLAQFVPSANNEVLVPFTKQRVKDALDTIGKSDIVRTVKAGLTFHRMTKEEVVTFSFASGTLQEFQENRTERKLLRERLFRAGCQVYVSDEVCAEIEKVGIHIYRSLFVEKDEKGTILCDADKRLEKARFLYDTSLDKLGNALNRKLQTMENASEVSAYFSAIVYEVALEQAIVLRHQAESIESVHEQAKHQFRKEETNLSEEVALRPIVVRLEETKAEVVLWEAWCERWIQARVNSHLSFKEPPSEENKQYVLDLKEKVNDLFRECAKQAKAFGSRILPKEERTNIVENLKERVNSYFAIRLDERKQELKTNRPKRQDMEEIVLPY